MEMHFNALENKIMWLAIAVRWLPSSSLPPSLSLPVPLTPSLNITVVEVFFTTPEVTVPESVGASEVCVNSNTESARPYNVTLSRMPSGSNPATRT